VRRPRLRLVDQQTKTADLRFFVVPKDQLDAWWPEAANAVLAVKKRNPASWSPEQVRQVVETDRALLCLTFHGKRVAGITFVCRDGDQFADAFDWLVWIAWADPNNVTEGVARAVTEFTQREIEAEAMRRGARALRIHVPRKGWTKLAEKLGYELLERVYVRRLVRG